MLPQFPSLQHPLYHHQYPHHPFQNAPQFQPPGPPHFQNVFHPLQNLPPFPPQPHPFFNPLQHLNLLFGNAGDLDDERLEELFLRADDDTKSVLEHEDLVDYLAGWDRYCKSLRHTQLASSCWWERQFDGDPWVKFKLETPETDSKFCKYILNVPHFILSAVYIVNSVRKKFPCCSR
ncbi:hypothetical protein CPB84DRAFT_193577 [Gymnopilus junonius]|uniref:Uncharacterized protein n=1 Tax=Gymnopilus junonius TaxID=109634 RepID=A0A9P5ND23_GYMJU|nr:hypothetical protein CPB84DRAFT_193577 [Gymnopilus junonius]